MFKILKKANPKVKRVLIKILIGFCALILVSIFAYTSISSYIYLETKKSTNFYIVSDNDRNTTIEYYNKYREEIVKCKLTQTRTLELRKLLKSPKKHILYYSKIEHCDIYFENSRKPTKKFMWSQFFLLAFFIGASIFTLKGNIILKK